MTAAPPLILVGAGPLARETVEAVRASNSLSPSFDLIAFVDDNPALAGTTVGGIPVLGPIDEVERHPSASVVICTAGTHDPSSRWRIAKRLGLDPERYATVIHPGAVLPPDTQIGPGSVVLASVIATTALRVGAHNVLMPAGVFAHDCITGDYATFAAGVRLGGRVRIGEGAYLGAGAMVRENQLIGRWAVIGMGAVVTHDVPQGEVWAGVPARCLRSVGAIPGDAGARSDA